MLLCSSYFTCNLNVMMIASGLEFHSCYIVAGYLPSYCFQTVLYTLSSYIICSDDFQENITTVMLHIEVYPWMGGFFTSVAPCMHSYTLPHHYRPTQVIL